MRGIFISYRRDDAEGQAGRLFDDLSAHFGPDAVFMDVAGIKKGQDFRRIIDEHVTSCGVLLVIIGKRWLDVTDSKGNRRLDDPNDFVRLETAAALSRDIPVVPVLVHDAAMPTEHDLPDALKELAFRNGTELTHARWESDVKLLIEDLRPYLDLSPAAARATPSIQPTRERSVVADTGEPSGARGRSLWVTAGAVVIASGVSIAGYHYWPDPQSAQGVALAAAPTAAVPAAAAPPPAASTPPKVVEEPAKADPRAAAEDEAQRIASERAAAATVAAARAATARANAEAAARAAAARKDAQERRERVEAERATQLAAEQRKRDEENQRLLVAQAEKSRLAAEQAEKNRIAAEQAAAAKIFTDIAGAFINSRGNRR